MRMISKPSVIVALRLHVHLGDERAGGIELEHVAGRGRGRHRLRHAMGGEHHGPVAVRDLVQLLDEDGALGLQVIHHELVVHDLVAHIDRRAVEGERPLHDVDRPHHPGAEAPGCREQDGERRLCVMRQQMRGLLARCQQPSQGASTRQCAVGPLDLGRDRPSLGTVQHSALCGRDRFTPAPKEQPPRKLSGKRTAGRTSNSGEQQAGLTAARSPKEPSARHRVSGREISQVSYRGGRFGQPGLVQLCPET